MFNLLNGAKSTDKTTAIDKAVDAFPGENDFEFYKYDNPLEKKLAFDQIGKLPKPISDSSSHS